jgi:hypothetical protein
MTNIIHLKKAAKKFASDVKMSLVENSDPFLKRLSDCGDDFDKMNEMADKEFEKLGEGSSRAAYRLSEDLIIKIAINVRGLAQNLQEMQRDIQTDCFNKVICADAHGKWLTMEWTDKLTDEEFKKITGFTFKMFGSCLSYCFDNETDDPEPRDYDEIKKLPLFICLSQLIIDESLLIGDINKLSSFGIKNGKILLRDGGFSKQIFHNYYSSNGSSSSSSTPQKTSS